MSNEYYIEAEVSMLECAYIRAENLKEAEDRGQKLIISALERGDRRNIHILNVVDVEEL